VADDYAVPLGGLELSARGGFFFTFSFFFWGSTKTITITIFTLLLRHRPAIKSNNLSTLSNAQFVSCAVKHKKKAIGYRKNLGQSK
jgi:hypothetical protein